MTDIAPDTRAKARRLRSEMTPQERRVWAQLRDFNHRLGLNFRRQAPVGRFIADFADFGRQLVIEVDGGQHGGADDAARDAWFQTQGFTILRFWNADVDGNLDGVMQVVLDALEACPPPPQGGRRDVEGM
ncbi:endonuclease domain-containing protein [Tabrizicola oligotrophica]|uniref:Endonuclease domain-containing protein n=1 Tax=Tabrizicola oligotrophica TaxID=2710650 RepID=A0A6M0QSS6_9RHOB|nr:endonuclease domain-containing protein [Tabrizicola oligotrophica]NEY90520.1 endonuclease domain-containing protein [Tabrizicola oligotrophica]